MKEAGWKTGDRTAERGGKGSGSREQGTRAREGGRGRWQVAIAEKYLGSAKAREMLEEQACTAQHGTYRVVLVL